MKGTLNYFKVERFDSAPCRMNIHEKINKRREKKLNLIYKKIEEINKIIDEKEDLFLKKYETNDFIPTAEELQQLPSDEEYNKRSHMYNLLYKELRRGE